MRRLATTLAALGLVLTVAAPVLAGGPPKVGFYVDDVLYRTVGTPTDFTNTGAPASTYDRIYALGAGLRNVADSKPGDTDFNGGRWAVYPVTWNTTPFQVTNDHDLLGLADQGLVTIGSSPVKLFFCNVAPIPPGQS